MALQFLFNFFLTRADLAEKSHLFIHFSISIISIDRGLESRRGRHSGHSHSRLFGTVPERDFKPKHAHKCSVCTRVSIILNL
jgi:hypothetical protein